MARLEVVRRQLYNGMNLDTILKFPGIIHQCAVSPTHKQVLEVPFTLQTHSEAYKYEPELVFSSWSSQYPEIKPRSVRSSWWRNEQILCAIKDRQKLRQWRDAFLEAARICDAFLKGIM